MPLYFLFPSIRIAFLISWRILVLELKSVFFFSSVKLFCYFSRVKEKSLYCLYKQDYNTNTQPSRLMDEKNGGRSDASTHRIWPFIFTPTESAPARECGSNTNSGRKPSRVPTLRTAPRLHAVSFLLFLLLKPTIPLPPLLAQSRQS